MQLSSSPDISSIVFDLDGTLYVSSSFAAAINDQSAAYIAGIRGISLAEARCLLSETRSSLAAIREAEQTLSTVCTELGGNIRDLHTLFAQRLHPEGQLMRDERVIILLERLRQRCQLYIYTNNNRTLTTRILHYLGIDGMFARIFTIDDTWIAKPDEAMLDQVITATGQAPCQVLFVGDRYDIDLALPEMKGCPVYLSRSIDQLLRLEELLV